MASRQKPGVPIVARAMFGKKGQAASYIPKYAMRTDRVTDRVDSHVDHYVGGEFSHRETRTSYDTRYEDVMVSDGVERVTHDTVRLLFEDAENATMEVKAPHWAYRGDLVYVACHRGIGSIAYDLHPIDKGRPVEVIADVAGPIPLRWPALLAVVTFVVQAGVLHKGLDPMIPLYAGGAGLGAIVLHRIWRQIMLALSRRRALAIVRGLRRKDAPRVDEIRRTIRDRVAGWE